MQPSPQLLQESLKLVLNLVKLFISLFSFSKTGEKTQQVLFIVNLVRTEQPEVLPVEIH